jgi:peptidoglycan/LPS O-acetylase OafA/YrhL
MSSPRYETLDGLRGIGALSVVFWYWPWLYCPPGDAPILADPSIQPFFWILAPLYRHGFWGVEMFFSISGCGRKSEARSGRRTSPFAQ